MKKTTISQPSLSSSVLFSNLSTHTNRLQEGMNNIIPMGTSALPSKRTFTLANPFSWEKTKNFIVRIPGMDDSLCATTKDAKGICCVASIMITTVFIPFILVAFYCYNQYRKEGGDNE